MYLSIVTNYLASSLMSIKKVGGSVSFTITAFSIEQVDLDL